MAFGNAQNLHNRKLRVRPRGESSLHLAPYLGVLQVVAGEVRAAVVGIHDGEPWSACALDLACLEVTRKVVRRIGSNGDKVREFDVIHGGTAEDDLQGAMAAVKNRVVERQFDVGLAEVLPVETPVENFGVEPAIDHEVL